MSFDRVRVSGGWILGSAVAPGEWEQFDENQSNAIDGLNGGAYSLQDDLEIGGAPGAHITFTTEFIAADRVTMNSTLIVDGNTYLESDVYVGSGASAFYVNAAAQFDLLATFNQGAIFDGDTTFSEDVTIGTGSADTFSVNSDSHFYYNLRLHGDILYVDSDVELAGSTLTIGGATTISSSLGVSGPVTFNDAATFNSSVVVNSNVQIGTPGSTSIILRAQTILRQPMLMQDSGKFVTRTVAGADANTNYIAAQVDAVVCHDDSLTGARSYTIDDTGALDGMAIEFFNNSDAFSISVRKPSGTVLAVVGGTSTGVPDWIKCVRMSGSWELAGAQFGA